MRSSRIVAVSGLAGIILLMSTGFAAKRETGFLDRTMQVAGISYRYQVFVPQKWDKNRKWPVILFLHGAGERGDDGILQTQVGIATAIRMHPERFPFIVVFPQCRKDSWWSAPAMESQALKALDLSIREFKGDPDRVCLTGISMGGYGTWDAAFNYPGRFAGLAPVCGGIRPPGRVALPAGSPLSDPKIDPYALVAQKVGKTPVWIFHGGADNVVPVAESQKMNEALKAAGGDVKYTEYPGVGHNSWDRAYAEPDLAAWLLARRRPAR